MPEFSLTPLSFLAQAHAPLTREIEAGNEFGALQPELAATPSAGRKETESTSVCYE